MNSTISPAEALARIPGWDTDAASWQEIKGGLTNRSYLVEYGGEAYVLRLDAAHTNAFDLDRTAEIRILRQAAEAGLAPQLVFADSDAGVLLSRYISGDVWAAADLDDNRKLETLAVLLRRVHAMPLSGVSFDRDGVTDRYTRNLAARPGLHAFALRCQQFVADCPASGEIRCCHNDVVAANVIGYPALQLLDWEYACDNDPLFDLASLIGFHNLSMERRSVLLSAYAGGSSPALSERLAIQVRLYDAIQWLWLANRQIITRSSAQAKRLEELQQRIG
jgi:thiamine kinase